MDDFNATSESHETHLSTVQEYVAGWDEAFAENAAAGAQIHGGLTDDHWQVILFIRRFFESSGRCPTVYQVCRANDLSLARLRWLFPTGFRRGACRLAGLADVERSAAENPVNSSGELLHRVEGSDKAYRLDAAGFLLDSSEWDEAFAESLAPEVGRTKGLSGLHWLVLYYLRQHHDATGSVATLYQTCDACGLDIDSLEDLFPTGYHRGAVKLAGLREPFERPTQGH